MDDTLVKVKEEGVERTCRQHMATLLVYFLSSLRGQTAKTLICTKSGVSADSRKSTEKCGEPHFLRKKCTKNARKARFSALFGTLSGIGGKNPFCAD